MLPSLARPLALFALLAPALAFGVWWRWRPALPRGAARVALGLRLAVLTLAALALAGLQLGSTPAARTLVVAVDRSASPLGALGGEDATVASVIRAKGVHDRVGVVTFGQDAQVEDPPSQDVAFAGFGTRPGPNFTDIESALRLSGSLMPQGTRRQVVLLSDGRQNSGDAVAQARLLRTQGVRVDVLPIDVPSGPEVRVDDLVVPSTVSRGARAQARVDITSNIATSAQLRIEVDGAVVVESAAAVPSGQSSVTATLPPATAGFHTVRALLDPVADTVTENNVGEALFQVLGAQRVLVVEGHPGEGANVAAALRAANIDATVVSPGQVPSSAAQVAAYQSVALVDVSADELGTNRMTALATATRGLGVGLAAFGGTETFGPGGLAGTPLEAALPIDMRIPDRSAKPPVAVVLVLESVENPSGDAVVRGAARSLVAHLNSTDFVGVTDSIEGFAVPLQQVSDPSKVESAIANIPSFGDPPSYVPYMADAEKALLSHPDATKHMIILGDGDGQLPSSAFMAHLVHEGITVSAVGVDVEGVPQYMAAMHTVADEGNGRFYQSESADQIPDIFLDETRKSLQPWIVEQQFRPSLGAPSQALAGIDTSAFPALGGYVSATPKNAAQVALAGPNGDPILAEWTYGAGRAAAWTSDTDGRWSAQLLAWPQAGRLLAGIVASTLPLTPDPALQVGATVHGDQLHVLAQLPNPPVAATAAVTVVAPDGTTRRADLVGTAPGRYEADVPANQVGAYLLRVGVSSGRRELASATAGAAIAYSPEYRFIGTDKAVLADIASAGGGEVLGAATQAFAVTPPPVRVERALAMLLLVLAALLFPVDVAVRRLALRRADVAELRRLAPRRRLRAPTRAQPNVARLREQIATARTQQRSARVVRGAATPPAGPPAGSAAASAAAGSAAASAPSGSASAGSASAGSAPSAGPDGDSASLASRLLERRRAVDRRPPFQPPS